MIFASRLHPGYISPPSRSTKLHLSSIQASSQTHTGFKMCVSPPSRSFLKLANCISAPSQSHITLYTSQDVHINSILVPSQPHPGLEISVSSPPRLPDSRFFFVSVESYLNLGPDFASRLHPGNISPPSRSTKLHLSSIQASSQTHTSIKMCVSPPSRSFLNWRIVSQLHASPISPYPRLKMCISTRSRSHLNPIQV